jgi:hypothetical protein
METLERVLTLQDRCDSCGAAARIVATLASGELLFCGHHGRQYSQALVSQAIQVYDPEGEINLYN